jgi:hypothetical protein
LVAEGTGHPVDRSIGGLDTSGAAQGWCPCALSTRRGFEYANTARLLPLRKELPQAFDRDQPSSPSIPRGKTLPNPQALTNRFMLCLDRACDVSYADLCRPAFRASSVGLDGALAAGDMAVDAGHRDPEALGDLVDGQAAATLCPPAGRDCSAASNLLRLERSEGASGARRDIGRASVGFGGGPGRNARTCSDLPLPPLQHLCTTLTRHDRGGRDPSGEDDHRRPGAGTL